MSIFVQPTVSHCRESKVPFDDTERVFHLCPDAGLVSVSGSFIFSQPPIAAALRLGEVVGAGSAISDGLSLTDVRRISPDAGFLAMEQIGQNLRVVDVSCCSDHAVNAPCATVDVDMGLHAEVPLMAFVCLAHLWIALFLFVPGGTRCIDDAGINNRATGNLHPTLLHILVHEMEPLIAQMVFLHQVAERAYPGLIRHGLSAKIDTDEQP